MSQEQDRAPVAWNDGCCANYIGKLLSAPWLLNPKPVESQHRHTSTPAPCHALILVFCFYYCALYKNTHMHFSISANICPHTDKLMEKRCLHTPPSKREEMTRVTSDKFRRWCCKYLCAFYPQS